MVAPAVGQNLRVNVQICGEKTAVKCESAQTTIGQLVHLALGKLRKLRPELFENNCAQEDRNQDIRNGKTGSLLDPDELAHEQLNDDDLLILGSQTSNGDHSHRAPASINRKSSTVNGRARTISQSSLQAEMHDLGSVANHNLGELDLDPRTAPDVIVLSGGQLDTKQLMLCSKTNVSIKYSKEAVQRVNQSRKLLEEIVRENRVVYGVSTGFGNFASVRVDNDKLAELQLNLIRSHCCGVGEGLTLARVRRMLAVRLNVFAKGYSGISMENVQKMVACFNACCLSFVPQKGTVGCCGDLSPLAHLALGMMGEGRMWSPKTGWGDANEVLRANNLPAIVLGPKEGIAMINGTQMVASLGAEAVERSISIARQADVIAALSIDVLKGTTNAFDADIQRIRPHVGQGLVAERLRALLHNDVQESEIAMSHRMCDRVQDAYSLRCVPQVHGIVHDTIVFVSNIINIEINSATDNPLVFADRGEIISGGNFHGEYPAKALDYLAIAVAELAQISERRLERLLNTTLSELPAFLTKDGGLNSGFMMVQVTAASLVSENKVKCHPSSADSIPTSCNQEDHVSMGGYAARKALEILENVEYVLACELLAACQGMEFLNGLKSTPVLHRVYQMVRQHTKAIERDRMMQPEIDAAVRILREEKVWQVVKSHLEKMKDIEVEDPDAFRMGSPTGYVRDNQTPTFPDTE